VCLGSGTRAEGLNGRLPNQDLLNSFHIISGNTGGVPVLLYDNHNPKDGNWRDPLVISWLPGALRNNERVKDYVYRARNLLSHFSYQARGHPSGIHGLLHQYAKPESLEVPSTYCSQIPHRRFHDIRHSSNWSTWLSRNRKVTRPAHPLNSHSVSYRIVESTLRTCSNLLERLHASFFFYLLPEPGSFTKIGNYLPSAVIISTAILFSGLRSWVQAGWVEVPISGSKEGQTMKWERRSRPSLQAVLVILVTHAWGVPLYFISSWPILPRLVCMPYVPCLQR
jgi:glycosylphosphatidylinositol transamidase